MGRGGSRIALIGAATGAALVLSVGASSAPHATNVPVLTGVWPLSATVTANSDSTGWLGPTYRVGAVNARTWRFTQPCSGGDCETDLHRATDSGGAATRILYRGNNEFAWQENLTSTDSCGTTTFTGLTVRVDFTMDVKTVSSPTGRPVATSFVAVGNFVANVNVSAYVNAGCAAPPSQIRYTIRYTGKLPGPAPAANQVYGFPAPGYARGTVKMPGKSASPIRSGQRIPRGTVIDVTNGRGITLADTEGMESVISAANGARATFVYAGVVQRHAELRLTGGRFRSCSGESAVRGLWSEGDGKFRTKGRYASAAGAARWLTVDYCTRTVVQVMKGTATVRDLVKKKTVVVRAGKSYSAGPS